MKDEEENQSRVAPLIGLDGQDPPQSGNEVMADAAKRTEGPCPVCGFRGPRSAYIPHDCYWVFRERGRAANVR